MAREEAYIGTTEVVQFAIRIEENGEKFYRKIAAAIGDKKIRDLFTFLADEEVKHKEKFEKMLSEVEKYEPSEAYPPEYFAYLRAFANNIIFNVGIDKDLPEKPHPVSALDFGIRREADSIAYYQETRGLVPADQRNLIDKIIEEERKHLLKFSELKKTLQEGSG